MRGSAVPPLRSSSPGTGTGRIRESNETLYWICEANPFSHAVELVRFALYAKFEPVACAVVIGTGLAFFTMAVIAYDPGRGIMARRGGPAGDAT